MATTPVSTPTPTDESAITAIRPLYDRVLVRQLEEKTMVGMLHLPDNAREKPHQGRVISVGQGYRMPQHDELVPTIVQVGDVVLFGKYAGSEIEVNGEKFLVMREEEILGIAVVGEKNGESKLTQ